MCPLQAAIKLVCSLQCPYLPCQDKPTSHTRPSNLPPICPETDLMHCLGCKAAMHHLPASNQQLLCALSTQCLEALMACLPAGDIGSHRPIWLSSKSVVYTSTSPSSRMVESTDIWPSDHKGKLHSSYSTFTDVLSVYSRNLSAICANCCFTHYNGSAHTHALPEQCGHLRAQLPHKALLQKSC